MRRKISLYVADNIVDLDDQSLILFNYTMEDLLNPTIVKNSYSHQITIKGTPNNNRLFGDIFRLDRVVTYNGGTLGTDFNPSQKTPFVIYNEMNEILESGYCKLDSVTRKKGEIEYQISLFGGLGSFIYSLAYDAEGNKRTLADLDYLGTDNTESELDFVIDANNVAAAWDTITSEGEIDNIWKVINFAPAYNGIPEGKFSADKALVVPSQVGLKDEITEGTGAEAVKYGLKNGYAMVNLSQKYDEWSVKDLRSYLQRPVFSIRAFLEAIKKPHTDTLKHSDIQPSDRQIHHWRICSFWYKGDNQCQCQTAILCHRCNRCISLEFIIQESGQEHRGEAVSDLFAVGCTWI